MNNKSSLIGYLMRIADGSPKRRLFTKSEILTYSRENAETVAAIFKEWEKRGFICILEDINSAQPEATVVLINDINEIYEIDREDCALYRAEIYRNLDPKEGGKDFWRLGPSLMAETLEYLEPEIGDEYLKSLEPKMRAETLEYMTPTKWSEALKRLLLQPTDNPEQ